MRIIQRQHAELEEIAKTMQRIRQTQVGVVLVDSSVEFAHMPTMTRR